MRRIEGPHAEPIKAGISLLKEIRAATGYCVFDWEPEPEELLRAMEYLQRERKYVERTDPGMPFGHAGT